MKRALIFLSLITTVLAGALADPAQRGLFLDQSAQASYNPLGFQLVSKFYYEIPLSTSHNILWESTKIDMGAQSNLSPSYEFFGAFLNIEPIALFSVAFTAQLAGYYPAFGFGFYDLSGYNAGFDSNALAKLTPKSAAGYLLSAAPTLKAAFGPLVLLDTGSMTYYNVDGGQGYFYERIGNTVLSKSGTELLNQAYVMVRLTKELLAGANDYLLYVPDSGYVSHRIAAIVAYSGRLNERISPYGALLLGTFLADRYFLHSFYIAGQVGATLRL